LSVQRQGERQRESDLSLHTGKAPEAASWFQEKGEAGRIFTWLRQGDAELRSASQAKACATTEARVEAIGYGCVFHDLGAEPCAGNSVA